MTIYDIDFLTHSQMALAIVQQNITEGVGMLDGRTPCELYLMTREEYEWLMNRDSNPVEMTW